MQQQREGICDMAAAEITLHQCGGTASLFADDGDTQCGMSKHLCIIVAVAYSHTLHRAKALDVGGFLFGVVVAAKDLDRDGVLFELRFDTAEGIGGDDMDMVVLCELQQQGLDIGDELAVCCYGTVVIKDEMAQSHRFVMGDLNGHGRLLFG